MGNRSSIMKFCLLFLTTVAFIVLPGLSTHSVTTADTVVKGESVEEAVDWSAAHFELIDYPVPVRIDEQPGFDEVKKTVRIENSDFFMDKPLIVQGDKDEERDITGIVIDRSSYVFLKGSVESTNEIIIKNNSKVCSESALKSTHGDIELIENSVLYLTGTLEASEKDANLKVDNTSRIYLQEGSSHIVGGKVHGQENIIILNQEDFAAAMNANCFKDPENVPEPKPEEGELKVKKTASVETVQYEDEFKYTIEIQNDKTNAYSFVNLKVKDILPKEVELLSNSVRLVIKNEDGTVKSTDEFKIDENDFEITIPKLKENQKAYITYQVKVIAHEEGIITNSVEVMDPLNPTNPLTDEVDVTLKPIEGNFITTKEVDKKTVYKGDEFKYTIKVFNNVEGSNLLEEVHVVDELPEGLEFVNGTVKKNDKPVEVTETAEGFEVMLSGIEYGQEVQLTFNAIANRTGSFTNKAVVTHNGITKTPKTEVKVIDKPIAGVQDIKKSMYGETEYSLTNTDEPIVWRITYKFNEAIPEDWKSVMLKDEIHKYIKITDITLAEEKIALPTDNVIEIEIPKKENSYTYLQNKTLELTVTGNIKKEYEDDFLKSEAIFNIAEIIIDGKTKKSNKVAVYPPELDGSIEIIKEDEGEGRLARAEFALYRCDEGNMRISECDEAVAEGVTALDGTILFEKLGIGYYRLIETKAPAGYRLLSNPVDVGWIDFDNKNQTITIKNYRSDWELPATGGIGTLLFYGVGGALMLGALYFIFRKQKRK